LTDVDLGLGVTSRGDHKSWMAPAMLQMQMTVMLVRPVVVSLDLASLLFRSEHDDDASILLPYDFPKVLILVSTCLCVVPDATTYLESCRDRALCGNVTLV
jgi:hypothetical protein